MDWISADQAGGGRLALISAELSFVNTQLIVCQ